jgi:hypothetical protein
METRNLEKYIEGKPWGYKLSNKVNGKWYYGVAKQSPEVYTTSSKNTELNSAINKDEIVRSIEIADDSYDYLKTWEREILTENNAAQNPMSYNNSNFTGAKDKTTVDDKLMRKVADDILNHNTVSGVNPVEVDITNEVEPNNKTKFKPDSIYNNILQFQVRDNLLSGDHIKNLIDKIDQHYGNLDRIEEETGQKLIIVVLEDRLHKGRNVPLRIGGNHTWKATLKSQFGFKFKILYIPKSVHSQWSDLEIRILGQYLNPRDKKTILETNEDDAVKTGLEIFKKTNKSSTTLNSYLNNENWTPKQKDRIKQRVGRDYEKLELLKTTPQNFIDYSTEEEFKLVTDKVKELEEPNCLVKYMSTGKASIADPVSKIIHEIYNGETRLEKIKIVLYHPSMKHYNEFKIKWEQYFPTWQRLIKHENINLTWYEMPHLTEEGK